MTYSNTQRRQSYSYLGETGVKVARRVLLEDAEQAADTASRQKLEELGAPYATRDPWTCPECETAMEAGDWMRDVRCQCTKAAADAAREAYLKEHRAEAVAAAWSEVDAPRRFADATFDTFEPRDGATEALERCQKYASSFDRETTTNGLFLFGRFGSGKTHLAIATARRILERTFTEPIIVAADALVSRYQESDFSSHILAEPIDAELLVLDDLGQTRATDFRRETIYRVIDERYREERPTLLTSNLGDGQLREVYGGALVSRLWEMARPIEVTATDYRAQLAKERKTS